MSILETHKNSISIARNSNIITDDTFKKILENCFSFLIEKKELHATNNLHNTKLDVVKEFYGAVLSITAEFGRKNIPKEDIFRYLNEDCGLSRDRINLYNEFFDKERRKLEVVLLNIGNTLPHVTDVKWKIDYIVKSSEVDCSEGPLFRICLVAEKYDTETDNKVLKNIHFTCNSVELLDLIYKLKDALRHCNNVTHRIF